MKEMSRQEYDSRDYSFDEIEDDPRLVSAKKRDARHFLCLPDLRHSDVICGLLLRSPRYARDAVSIRSATLPECHGYRCRHRRCLYGVHHTFRFQSRES